MTTRGSWKQTERAVAVILGGRRIPVSGRARGDQPDIDHPRLAIEVKVRDRDRPRMLERWLQQAEAQCRDGKTPIVVVHGSGERLTEAMVVLRLDDFARLMAEQLART